MFSAALLEPVSIFVMFTPGLLHSVPFALDMYPVITNGVSCAVATDAIPTAHIATMSNMPNFHMFILLSFFIFLFHLFFRWVFV